MRTKSRSSIVLTGLALLVGGALLLAAEVPPDILWTATFHATDDDEAMDAATGPDGHPVVAGFSCTAAGCASKLIKYDSATGTAHWTSTFDNDLADRDLFFAVAIGADGHPVGTGWECNLSFNACVARVVKFDGATGALLWSVALSPREENFGAGVAVGPDGHPVVSVESCDSNQATCVFRIVKLDGASGATLWSVAVANDVENQPNGIAVGADGHAVVTGYSCNADTSVCDVRTVKVDGANGSVIWAVSFDSGFDSGGEAESGTGVAVGPDGHVVVNGRTCTEAEGCAIRTIKYNGSTGALLWSTLYDSGSTATDSGTYVEIGADGHPVTNAGTCAPYPDCQARTIKRDGNTGAIIWDITFGAPNVYDFASGVALGVDGNPVVATSTCDVTFSACDFRTIKYRLRYDTPAGTNVAVPLNGGSAVADGISVTYTAVAVAGTTSVATDTDGPAPPAGFNFIGPPPIYYELATTAAAVGPITVCINYSTRPFAQPESALKLMHFEGGSWLDVTTSVDTTAHVICGSVTSFSPFAIAQPAGGSVTSLGPASVWVGLKNSDDVGIRFDLRAEVYRNDVELVGSGELASVPGGSSGFNNARLNVISLQAVGQVPFPPGSKLSIQLLVRNACSGSRKSAGTARLWFNDASANSRFDITIDTAATYYLRAGFALSTSPGSGPKATSDAAAGPKCSPYKSFGRWSTIVQ